MITRDDFARELLAGLDSPAQLSNLYALVAWMTAEGSEARFNPLATTRLMPGSTDFNSVHVQNYLNLEQGVHATVLTLRERGHRYGPIRRHLRRAHAAPKTLKAVEQSAWGTGGLALKVLPQVRDDYKRWALMPIGQ